MRERLLFASLLVLILSISGCSKQEEGPTPEELAAMEAAIPDRPQVGDMVTIPAGEFTFGSDKKTISANYAAPEQKINLPAYEIDVYEVTNGQWIEFVTQSNFEPESNWRQFYTVGKENFPVSNITLDDAKEYAKWAKKRLPTEAEWEKAARGPEGFAYPWGNTWDWSKSNCGENGRGNTTEVGEMKYDKSAYGVYDLMGNVMEWTGDPFKAYKGSPIPNNENFTRGYYAVRGGSFVMYPSKGEGMYLWTRQAYFPKSQYGIGFRCVRDIAPAATRNRSLPKYLALLLPNFDNLLSE